MEMRDKFFSYHRVVYILIKNNTCYDKCRIFYNLDLLRVNLQKEKLFF